MQSPRVLSVNVGRSAEAEWASSKSGRSAIDKRPTTARVRAGRLGLAGDEQADTRHHGGVDQAVYAYAREDMDFWAAELGRDLRPGQFGENLTTTGMDITTAVIGERWRVGGTLLEVSCPRIPCSVFQAWMGESRWVRRFTAEGRSGTYLRVLAEGELGAGDEIAVVHRPGHGLTVAETFRAVNGDKSLAPRLLEAPELPAKGHATARRLLGLPGLDTSGSDAG